VYRRYIGIPPGGTVTVQLDLQGAIDAGADYRLTVGVQPMVNADTIEAVVHPTDGWLVDDASGLRPDVDRRRVSLLMQPGHDISATTTFRTR
jgi:hypothetical protein